MTTSPRPYEASKTQNIFLKNIWWLGGVLAVIAIIGALFWFNSQNKSAETYSYTTLVNSTDTVYGNKDSQYTVVFFEDFTCGVCANNHPDFNKVIDTYSDKAKFTFKPVSILPKGGDIISRGVYAAGNQGKFREYAAKVYEQQKDVIAKRETTLIAIGQELGLDMTKFNEDRNFNIVVQNKVFWNDNDVKNTVFNGGIERSGSTTEQPLTGTRVKEKNIGITATPTVAILKGNDVVSWWDGYADAATIGKRLDEQLAK
jgi:Thioredoxin